ncbi:phage major capsid protein [Streptomyces sp. BRA346]|uniref:phage major capsid protein n=1 Tax=Streptomyces sp. BRA346 TaxID=2878199 RepID=UPI004063B439
MFNSANAAILPPEYGKLVIEPMTAASVAMQVATVVPTGAAEFHFPRVTSDVTAGWTAEGAAINASDADTDAYVVTPKKLASLTTLSNELVNDSSPAALQLVGDSIARAAVTAGIVWAISAADVFVVLRNGVEIAVDKSSAFASDSTQVRGILRAAPAFPRLDSIAKIYDAA